MKANELRIENLVYSIPLKKVFKMTGSVIALIENSNHGKFYIPLRITEDILMKVGYEIIEQTCIDAWMDIPFSHQHFKIFYDCTGFFHEINCNYIQVNHVHVFQNLYYMLNGVEFDFSDAFNILEHPAQNSINGGLQPDSVTVINQESEPERLDF